MYVDLSFWNSRVKLINDKLSKALKIKHFSLTTTIIIMKYDDMRVLNELWAASRTPAGHYFIIMIVVFKSV